MGTLNPTSKLELAGKRTYGPPPRAQGALLSEPDYSYRPGFKPKTQRRVPSGRRHIVTWPSGGATGIASSNGTNSPSIIQPLAVDDVRT